MIKHIAIIPDGNRRWAKEHNLPSFEGHRVAFEKVFPTLLEKASELGVEYFTFWALSTENLTKRTNEEIDGLLNLGMLFYKNKLKELKEKGVRVKFIGNIEGLPENTVSIIKDVTEQTKMNRTITLIIAINYGGRDEIMRAMKKVLKLNYLSANVTKDNFNQFLDTNGIPDPDLIIRTGGEKRVSGFMLWQSEYSELYFSDFYFPDFNEQELEKAVEDFQNRQRRFGK